jgi:alpha-N-acetylglucosaminidase
MHIRKRTVLLTAFLLLPCVILPCGLWAQTPATEAAMGVIQRLIPDRANMFTFSEIPADSGRDVYEVSAYSARVTIYGNNAVAMCRGAYDYLKNDCNALVTWDGDQLQLPDPLPSTLKRRVVCPMKYRHFLQTCTFGYSMPFWDWKRWERQIDWMALHGINFPLALVGEEKVWQTVFKSYGFSDAEIGAYFSGPAFLPFNRGGNLVGHEGPLPQSFIDFQADLQKKILTRQRELGMMPITPGFQGFVPPAFKTHFPAVKTVTTTFAGYWHNLQIEPREPMFAEMQKKMIAEYKKEYGEQSGYYLIDLYNEMEPSITPATKVQELQQIGARVNQGLQAADPKGVWVMMGWLFAFSRTFWTDPAIQGFFDSIPQQKLILLDLAADYDKYAAWSQFAPVRNRQVIWNMLLDFGGRTYLHGRFDQLVKRPYEAVKQMGSKVVGMGMTPESSDNNAAAYELMSDMMWQTTSPDPVTWLDTYSKQRYATTSPTAAAIWKGIYKNFYQWPDENHEYLQLPWQVPPAKGIALNADFPAMRALILQMLAASGEFAGNPLFLHDLVDVSKRYFGEKATGFIVGALGPAGAAQTKARADFNSLINGLDALLATVPEYSLDKWIQDARATVPEADKPALERDARMIMSPYWFSDYCFRDWSGLAGQYYRERWDRFFTGGQAAVDKFYSEWFNSAGLRAPEKVDPVAQVKKLLALTDPTLVIPIATGPRHASVRPGLSLRGAGQSLRLEVKGEGAYRLDVYTTGGRRVAAFAGNAPAERALGLAVPSGLYLAALRMQGTQVRARVLVP